MASKPQKPAVAEKANNLPRLMPISRHTLLSNGSTASHKRSHVPNHRHRGTASLSLAQVTDLIEASEHAEKIGRPLNWFVTIHFERARLKDGVRSQEAIGTWLRLAGQWLRSKDKAITNTFVWVIEHAIGTGEHVHIMIHCPPAYHVDFKKKACGSWMAKAGMLPKSKDNSGIVIEKIGPRGYPSASRPDQIQTYQNQLDGTIRYLIKGLDENIGQENSEGKIVVTVPNGRTLAIAPNPSSAIFGRRCSRSQNISIKASKQFGLAGGAR